jgi:hypothetical protein
MIEMMVALSCMLVIGAASLALIGKSVNTPTRLTTLLTPSNRCAMRTKSSIAI